MHLRILAVLFVFPFLLLAEQKPHQQAFVAIVPVANMYRLPDQHSDVVSQAIYASNVDLVDSKGGWKRVRTSDQYTGWMQASSLKKVAGRPYALSGSTVRVTGLSANIYREPDITKHAPIVNVPWESRLEVVSETVDEDHRWLKVRLPDGQEAYVQNGDVSADFAPITIEQTIALARKFLGITYTWGGTSSYGYDCSGFTQMLVRQRGITMPRDADVQAAWAGVFPVERKDLQPGDLLFFGSSLDNITHTGMYLGNGEFIHDTTHEHPQVQISKLEDIPWTKFLVAARRVKQ
jgi:cell wall-associated NlpC family hydrolase